MPINWICRFAVKRNKLQSRELLAHHYFAAQVETNKMKHCLAKIDADRV